MSRKVVLSRKRAEVEEESQKRTRLEEDVAQILQNISKFIVTNSHYKLCTIKYFSFLGNFYQFVLCGFKLIIWKI